MKFLFKYNLSNYSSSRLIALVDMHITEWVYLWVYILYTNTYSNGIFLSVHLKKYIFIILLQDRQFFNEALNCFLSKEKCWTFYPNVNRNRGKLFLWAHNSITKVFFILPSLIFNFWNLHEKLNFKHNLRFGAKITLINLSK